MRTLIKPTRTGRRIVTYRKTAVCSMSRDSHRDKARTHYNAPVAQCAITITPPIIGTPHQTQIAPRKLGYKCVSITTIVSIVIVRPPTRILQRKASWGLGPPHHKYIPAPIYRYTGSLIIIIPPEIRAPQKTQIAPRKLGYKSVPIITIESIIKIRPPTRISQRKAISGYGRPHHKHIPTPIYRYTVSLLTTTPPEIRAPPTINTFPLPSTATLVATSSSSPPKYVLHKSLRLLPENLAINASVLPPL
jgi:hypothetical protein